VFYQRQGINKAQCAASDRGTEGADRQPRDCGDLNSLLRQSAGDRGCRDQYAQLHVRGRPQCRRGVQHPDIAAKYRGGLFQGVRHCGMFGQSMQETGGLRALTRK